MNDVACQVRAEDASLSAWTEDRLSRAIATFTRQAAPLVQSADIDALLHVVAAQMSALVGVRRCSVHLRDDTTGAFRGCVGRDGDVLFDQDVKRLLSGGPADGMTREVVETQRPVIVRWAVDDPRTVKSTVRVFNMRSVLAVPMIFADEVVGLVFLDEADCSHAFIEEDGLVATDFARVAAMLLMHTRERVELCSQVERARRQVNGLRRAAAVDERLGQLIVEGQPLQHMIDALAELLGKPCAVFDEHGTRVATAVPAGADAGIAPRLLEPEIANRPAVRDVLAANKGSRAFVVDPLQAAGVLHRHVVAPVIVGGNVWGRLVVREHSTRFTGADLVIVRRAADFMAVQASTAFRVHDADRGASASLVAEMLLGHSEGGAIERRAEHLGIRLDAPQAIVVLGLRDRGDDAMPNQQAISVALHAMVSRWPMHVAMVGRNVVALAEMPADMEPPGFTAELCTALEPLLAGLPGGEALVAGISHVHTGQRGLRAGLGEALQVADCARRYCPAGRAAVVAADGLGAGRMFLATADRELVVNFAEETLGRMVDNASRADLLLTLRFFFDNMASMRRTAASMGVHENTVRYRLSRIEELTGLAVMHDPDAQLRARMSLLVLILQGRLSAAPAHGERERPTLKVV